MVKNITGAVDSWFVYQLDEALNKCKKDEELHLIITSNGGNVAQALAISDKLARHGNVTVEFSGVAASAATWLAYGAKKVVMHNDTLWLCHQASTPVITWESMNADDLEAYIARLESDKKSLEVIDAIIAKKYLDRCKDKGKNLKDVLDLMKEERYLSPDDCLAWGFVDELLPSTSAQNIVNSALLEGLNLPAVVSKNNVPAATATPAVDEKIVSAAAEAAVNTESFITKVADRLRSFFAPKEPAASNSQEPNKNNVVMKKTFVMLAALLAVDAFEEKDGNITLTSDQMKTIEDKLAALNAQVDSAKKAENALDAISDKVKAISGIENKANALALILDKMPTAGVVVAQPAAANAGEKGGVQIENADDINDYAQSMRRK